MAVETNARIEFSVASVEEWEKVNPKLHQGEPVFAKKPSGKYILKVGAPGGSTYKNAVVVWDQDDAEAKMTNTQTAATQALASKNAASESASAAKASENAAAASKSAAATSAANAKTSETNAAASKTAAANSASTASAKATAAGNSASAAATSEKNAAASSSAAAASESNALKSANAANTSAGNAKGSEANAKQSETNAANSAKAAAASASNAAKFDPSSYYSKTEADAKYMEKTANSNLDMNTHGIDFNDGLMEGNDDNILIQSSGDVNVYTGSNSGHLNVDGEAVATENYVDNALANKIPTKVSQLTDDVGIAKISNGHLSINGSELWIE